TTANGIRRARLQSVNYVVTKLTSKLQRVVTRCGQSRRRGKVRGTHMPTHRKTWPAHLGLYACGFGILTTLVFLAFPNVDLSVSRIFHVRDGAFSGQSLRWVRMLRDSFSGAFCLAIAISLAGLLLTRYRTRNWLGLGGKQWVFVAICLSMG